MPNRASKKGRPSIQSSLKMEKELRESFLKNYEPEFTAAQTGYDIKTVRRYFKQFVKEISQSEAEDFSESQKTKRTLTIMSYDRQIFEADQYTQEIKNEIKKTRDKKEAIPRNLFQLFSLYLEGMKFIAVLTERKTSYAVEPVPDKVLEKIIEERMKKYGKTG